MKDLENFADAFVLEGWTIEQKVGPGPLGENTATALARKGEVQIRSLSAAPLIALETLKRLIFRREEYLQSRASS